MKITLVSYRHPPEHSAGTEVYTANLARGLIAREMTFSLSPG